MADVDFPTRDGYRTQLREVEPGIYVPIVALADATSSGGSGGSTTPEAKLSFTTFTSAAGAQTLSIPAGALEISLANTGSEDATFASASMGANSTPLKPVTDPDGVSLNFVAPTGYVLEAMMVVAPVGVTIDYMIIKP